MGAVYLAEDQQLRRTVAIKIPRLAVSGPAREQARQRFLREIHLAAQVRHPHVCTIHDAGEDHGILFVVMEYVSGRSLEGELRRRGRYVDCKEAAALVARVARGLEAVHQRGIIHRDIKPGNILLDELGTPVLSDFGLASTDDRRLAVTADGYTVGTPAYMAPEQLSAPDSVDRRTDIYSLGVVLYQMLTGRLPFQGTVQEQIWQRCAADVPAPSSIRPDIDAALTSVLLTALSRQPANRYASASELAAALENCMSGILTAIPMAQPVRPRRPIALVAAVGMAVLLLVALVMALWPRPSSSSTRVDTSNTKAVPPVPTGPETTGRPLREFRFPGFANRAVYTASSGAVVVSSPDGVLAEIDTKKGEALHLMKGHGSDQVWALAVSPDGQFLLSGGDDRRVMLTDLNTQAVLKEFKGHEGSIKRVSFTPRKDRVVSVADDGTVRTWDTTNGKETFRFSINPDGKSVHATAFSADGRLLLNGRADGKLELYRVENGSLVKSWKAHDKTVCAVALSPDGKQALSGSLDRGFRLWDLRDYRMLADMPGHEEAPGPVTFVPGRRQALSADAKGTIYVWDLGTGRNTHRWSEHRFAVSSIAVAPSGQEFLSLCPHHRWELFFWRLP
jgi:serine/threonine protein kinase